MTCPHEDLCRKGDACAGHCRPTTVDKRPTVEDYARLQILRNTTAGPHPQFSQTRAPYFQEQLQ